MPTAADHGSESPVRALVLGGGSIGLCHRTVLADLGVDVALVSRRPGVGDYSDEAGAVEGHQPAYVVVATEAHDHRSALERLRQAGYRGRVLVEKPVSHLPGGVEVDGFEWVGVGYNLRFHPAVGALREALSSDRVLSVQARVGQHLSGWRPGRDYRDTVTAGVSGGALLELSHELDLLAWLVGPTEVERGWAVRTGRLDVELDDLAVCVLRLAGGGLASLELNLLDRWPTRRMVVSGDRSTHELDLLAGTLHRDGELVHPGPVERDRTFAAMHRAALSDGAGVCTVAEAVSVVGQVAELRRGGTDG
ncbi:MAG: Gfo/Idh/MocA family oxidoreductase [Actinomycetota bacterium]|nr:Gfo/Idh/MocA family oxidoreductase [Actinomycetota bacterium]